MIRSESSHAKQVRCDAASLGVPCTNCVAFQIECRIPVPKRKKGHTPGTGKDTDRFVSAKSPGVLIILDSLPTWNRG
ncbi:hypothetical protein IMZ48_37700 [Candidatus Bathyarchaeota archaeon]|nr:hypothetical protein [Candidatus Bathyarchaeota archaeon]